MDKFLCTHTLHINRRRNFKILLHPLIPIPFLIFCKHKMLIKLPKTKHFYICRFCIPTTHSVCIGIFSLYYMAKRIVQKIPDFRQRVAFARFTPFQSAYHTYTHWQNFRSFRFSIEYIFNPFGYRRDFFPGEKLFHNFFCILFSPEPILDITVMAAKFLRLG